MSTRELIEKAASLPIEERITIVEILLQSINKPDPEIDKKWVEIAKKRLLEIGIENKKGG